MDDIHLKNSFSHSDLDWFQMQCSLSSESQDVMATEHERFSYNVTILMLCILKTADRMNVLGKKS